MQSVNEQANGGLAETCLVCGSYCLLALCIPPLGICGILKQVQDYQRAVTMRLGRLKYKVGEGPGLIWNNPCTDTHHIVDLRTKVLDVPPQEIITKDSVSCAVDAVLHYRIFDPVLSVTGVQDAVASTRLHCMTTLRDCLSTRTMQQILSNKDAIESEVFTTVDKATDPWGIKVERLEIKDVRLPLSLQRSMAAEAEATNEAKAKRIAAEGELEASKALTKAAGIIADANGAIQLRYLQTLGQIATEQNSTIIFPVPIDMKISEIGKH